MPSDTDHLLVLYISYLRFLYNFYQNAHWTIKGLSFYSNHKLFEHLYQNCQEYADQTAEKLVGTFSSLYLDLKVNTESMLLLTSKYPAESLNDYLEQGLKAEQDFRKLLEGIKEALSAQDSYSLGFDNLLAENADESEKRSYFLKNSL